MNAYFISGGIIESPPEISTRLVDIVLAETRSKARYMFWQKHQQDLGGLNESWCEFCWKVSSDLEAPAGFVEGMTDLAQGILWGSGRQPIP